MRRFAICDLRFAIGNRAKARRRRPRVLLWALVVVWWLAVGLVHAQPAGDRGQPRDITGIEELPPLPPAPQWPYWLAGGLVGAGVVGFVAWRIARRQPGRPPLPPDRWALQELKRIAALRLAEHGQAERFHTLVSDVIRRYLEARYDLRAPKQTTQEFLRGLPEPSPLPAERQEKLAEFLRRCDLAKFAPVVVAVEECRQVLELARGVVGETSGAAHPVGRIS